MDDAFLETERLLLCKFCQLTNSLASLPRINLLNLSVHGKKSFFLILNKSMFMYSPGLYSHNSMGSTGICWNFDILNSMHFPQLLSNWSISFQIPGQNPTDFADYHAIALWLLESCSFDKSFLLQLEELIFHQGRPNALFSLLLCGASCILRH